MSGCTVTKTESVDGHTPGLEASEVETVYICVILVVPVFDKVTVGEDELTELNPVGGDQE